MIYVDPILKAYANLITANTGAFKAVYYGDPQRIGESELPALILEKLDTRASNMTSAEDEHQVRIRIMVVTDVRDSIGADKQLVAEYGTLYNLMEGRDPATYALKTDSLLYILRHNINLDTTYNLRTDLGGGTRVDYGVTIGKRAPDAWAVEGQIEITANFIQSR